MCHAEIAYYELKQSKSKNEYTYTHVKQKLLSINYKQLRYYKQDGISKMFNSYNIYFKDYYKYCT